MRWTGNIVFLCQDPWYETNMFISYIQGNQSILTEVAAISIGSVYVNP